MLLSLDIRQTRVFCAVGQLVGQRSVAVEYLRLRIIINKCGNLESRLIATVDFYRVKVLFFSANLWIGNLGENAQWNVGLKVIERTTTTTAMRWWMKRRRIY